VWSHPIAPVIIIDLGAATGAARESDCRLGKLIVLAWRGRENETRAGAGAVAAAARSQGQGWKLTWVEYARCVLELSLGRYQEAMAATPHAFEENRLVSAFAWADYVEAAVRGGGGDAAGEVLARFTGRVWPGGSPMALGLLARSRALLFHQPQHGRLSPPQSVPEARRALAPRPGPCLSRQLLSRRGICPGLRGAVDSSGAASADTRKHG
jgi:hypothetical protein